MVRRRCTWLLALLIGCGDNRIASDVGPPDAAVAPPFRDPVDLPDDELARQALQLLGAEVPGARASSCNTCHGLTSQHLRAWRALSDTALATCFTDLEVRSPASARAMLDCLRALPSPDADFQTRKLGIFASAARLPWFQYVFERAYGTGAPAQRAAFLELAGMPRGSVPAFTQAEFDVVAEWFVRGLPALDQVLVTAPPPTTCQPAITSAVAAHVATMATQGWQALDAQASLAMLGCGGATDPRTCLQSYPLAVAQPYGAGWEVAGRGHLRVLHEASYQTLFWTRSSPDGRFVAHGVSSLPGSYVVDLQRDAEIPIAAEYDPGFFPDGGGFVFQGGPANTCPIAVLTSDPAAVTMTEPGCGSLAEVGLYEQLGSTLGGGDQLALAGLFVSDDGGKVPTLADPPAAFVASAYAAFTPLVFDGVAYAPRATVTVATPFEGDAVLSPSARIMISRLTGPGDRQLGYVLRQVDATFTGTTYTIAVPELARYCMTGGKPAFSYDERWIAFHHYVGPDDAVELGFAGPGDPAFAPYLAAGAANLYLMELTTGVAVRITNMHPGQYALYPHFRADGWIYAEVRDTAAGREYTIASDAAL